MVGGHANFPLFVAVWLAVTTVLTLATGWFGLANRYPDRHEQPRLILRWQSGNMRGVGLNGMLNLYACPSGLRVQALRLFFPLAKPFFVPWSEIDVKRRTVFTFRRADLTFGNPPFGTLTVDAAVADRLEQMIGAFGRQLQEFPAADKRSILRGVIKEWFCLTVCAASFFVVGPRLLNEGAAPPPIAVTVLFPAIVLAIRSLVKYWGLTKN